MPPFILAIDVGTSSTKALAVTAEGYVLGSHQIAYPTHYPLPGFAEQDPNEILSAVKACVVNTIGQAKGDQLIAISFSAAMHSLVAVDQSGLPLSQLIIWSDLRSVAEAEEISQRQDVFDLYKETGTAVHPMLPLCKIMWMKKHTPEAVRNTYKFLSIKDYILFHLTGEWITDYSVAGASGLFDLRLRAWSRRALEIVRIDKIHLPRLVSTLAIVTLNESSCGEFHLPRGTKVIPGASDGCLANLGTNVIQPRELAITVGTSGAVRMTVNEPMPDLKRRIFNYWLDESRIVIGGATNNGAVLLSWFEQCFGKEAASMFDDVEVACRLRSEGLIFLPYVQGERAPIYDPHARGVFFGLGVMHNRVQLLRAVLEGVCFSLFSIAKSLQDVGGDYDIICASGGFTRSPGWLQLLSNVFGKVIKASDPADASAMGAARLALQALSIPDHFFDRDVEMKLFHPDLESHADYAKKYEIFLSLYRNLKQDFYNLSKLNTTSLT